MVSTWDVDEKFVVHRAVRWDPNAAKMTPGATVSMFTVHRAVRRERDILITRGDALRDDDPPVPFSLVFGEVVAIQHGRSRIIPKRQLEGVQKLLCIFLRRSDRLRNLVMRLYSFQQAMSRSTHAPPAWQ